MQLLQLLWDVQHYARRFSSNLPSSRSASPPLRRGPARPLYPALRFSPYACFSSPQSAVSPLNIRWELVTRITASSIWRHWIFHLLARTSRRRQLLLLLRLQLGLLPAPCFPLVTVPSRCRMTKEKKQAEGRKEPTRRYTILLLQLLGDSTVQQRACHFPPANVWTSSD